MKGRNLRIYTAIFLVSAATLTYEIGLTRLFSLAQGYHFAFMVISISLMGIGAGGTLLCFLRLKEDRDITHMLSIFSALFSVTVVVSYIAANQIIFDPVKAGWSKLEFLKILLQYLILSVPFLFSGMTIAALMRAMSARVHKIYLADMAGAGTGCLLILLILGRSGGEGVVVVAAALTLSASLLFRMPRKAPGLLVTAAALAAVILSAAAPEGVMGIKISPYRDLPAALNFPGGRVLETINSPSGRLDIIEGPAVRAAPGISLKYRRPLPPQRGFTINGGGLQSVISRGGDTAFLTHLPSALAYRLRKGGDIFIIDPGGGMEILSAMENGAGAIWGSETKSVLRDAMSGPLLSFSGELYNEARISPGYGRRVLKDMGKNFDIIKLPLTGTFGASSSGMRGFSEDYALTVEAFGEYLRHLKPDGVISISSYLLPPPRVELKLLTTAVEALSASGHRRPEANIIAIRSWGVMTLILKNGEVDDGDIETLKKFTAEKGFDIIWYPGMGPGEANIRNRFPDPVYHRYFKEILNDDRREAFLDDYLFEIRAPTDERPFFSQSFKMTRIRDTYEAVGRKWGVLIEGGYLLPWILLQAVTASVILILLPIILLKREKRPAKTLFYVSTYFAMIGAGFIFLEIALIQKLIPVLGEPVYAFSVVLFTILTGTGTGSYLSGRLKVFKEHQTCGVLLVAPVIIVYLLILGPVSGALGGLTIALKYAVTAAVFFPLGVVMGIPFPTGISILGERTADLIPWAWAVNGTVSVAGSVLVMMAAVYLGFSTAIFISAAMYLMAWLSLRKLKTLC